MNASGGRRGRSAQRVHGDIQGERQGSFARVYALVSRIPRGRVMTYGQIANLLEDRLSARAVGWALHGCPDGVPWQRVVNARGACSTERLAELPDGLQRGLLEREGVRFRENGTLDLARYRFDPPRRSASKAPGPRPITRSARGRSAACRP